MQQADPKEVLQRLQIDAIAKKNELDKLPTEGDWGCRVPALHALNLTNGNDEFLNQKDLGKILSDTCLFENISKFEKALWKHLNQCCKYSK